MGDKAISLADPHRVAARFVGPGRLGARRLALHEELGPPFWTGLAVDVEDEAVADAWLEPQSSQVDCKRNTEGRPGSQASWSSCLEAATNGHGLLADHGLVAIFVDEVEFPLMGDVRSVPWDGYVNRQSQWLRLRADDRYTSAKHEQLASAGLRCVAEQHVHT